MYHVFCNFSLFVQMLNITLGKGERARQMEQSLACGGGCQLVAPVKDLVWKESKLCRGAMPKQESGLRTWCNWKDIVLLKQIKLWETDKEPWNKNVTFSFSSYLPSSLVSASDWRWASSNWASLWSCCLMMASCFFSCAACPSTTAARCFTTSSCSSTVSNLLKKPWNQRCVHSVVVWGVNGHGRRHCPDHSQCSRRTCVVQLSWGSIVINTPGTHLWLWNHHISHPATGQQSRDKSLWLSSSTNDVEKILMLWFIFLRNNVDCVGIQSLPCGQKKKLVWQQKR